MLWLLQTAVALTTWETAYEAQPNPGTRDLLHNDYFVVEMPDPSIYSGWEVVEPFPITDHWLVSRSKDIGLKFSKRELNEIGIKSFYDSKSSRLRKKTALEDINEIRDSERRSSATVDGLINEFNITDPLFPQQWHIFNPQEPKHDMNVVPVWRRNITGKGVTVAIVDDGLDYEHPDFAHTFSLEGSWDYNLHNQYPKPVLSDDNHGTRCAGEVAAGLGDNACGVGIAPGAKVAGIRILSGELTKADEARALIHRKDVNDIYSCSWGPEDNGREIDGPSAIVKRAELDGVENGRQGRGSIYVVASGNGDYAGDNCNYDGYTNSIYSITVSAIDRLNQHPFYAESCSANMVVTYSSNLVSKIVTTDRRDPLKPHELKCTDKHSGTSAAAPIAAGVFALALEQRPELTWRDLQYLVRDTAKGFDIIPNDKVVGAKNRVTNDWQITADGHRYHNSYGYGLLDADAIVERASTWELVKPQSFYFLPVQTERKSITPSSELNIEVSQSQWEEANMDNLEHVRVRISYTHEQRGALLFQLTSPTGIVSTLALPREQDLSSLPVHDWEFLTVVHWNETGAGTWKLGVKGPDGLHGVVENWQLKFFGQAKDASKVRRYSEVWNEYESPASLVTEPSPTSASSVSSSTESSTDKSGSTESVVPSDSTSTDSTSTDSTSTDSTSTDSSSTDSTSTEPTAALSTDPIPQPTEPTKSEPTGTIETDKSDHPTSQPEKSGKSTHSIWFYLIASTVGIGLFAAACIPIIYFFYTRRSKLYERIDTFELDNFNDFELSEDELETGD